MMESVSKLRFCQLAMVPLEVRMRLDYPRDLLQHVRELRIAAEQQDGRLRITPRCVAEKLIDFRFEIIGALPHGTFGNEDITSLVSDQNVSLPLEVERLGSCLETRVERDEKMRPNVFLFQCRKHMRALFHYKSHLLD